MKCTDFWILRDENPATSALFANKTNATALACVFNDGDFLEDFQTESLRHLQAVLQSLDALPQWSLAFAAEILSAKARN
jgi:hypothetical protein